MDKDKTVLYATVQGRAEGGEGESLKDLKGGWGVSEKLQNKTHTPHITIASCETSREELAKIG